MHRKIKHLILHSTLLTALVAVTSAALADDPPARVARVSVVEGQVTVLEADGEEAGGNLVNWPVTSGTRITAAPGARTEFRVGSTAVRLDGDSSLEVVDLDDNVLRLRLDYGTANVRVRNPDQLSGFELTTPQVRVTLAEPGALRIDTERVPDTSVVTMLAGSGRVDGAGTSMSLRAGKRVEVRGDDIQTGIAQRNMFDDWVQARDRRDDNSQSLRYVTADMTGYEELDQHGSWRDDPDYGPLWAPRGVGSDWAPYRDGRWTWLEPWGWTWVDDAPWGYAPSHYGRWVFVQSRWFWAPGRAVVRPVWAPALVGWVGGSGWNVTFRDHRAGPGVGWYPLTPRDRYVPNYRVSVEHERRLEWQHNGKVRWKEAPRADGRRDGVTVLPREYFERRSIVNVGREPRVMLSPGDVRKAPLATAPPVAPPQINRPGRVIETRRDGRDERRDDRRDDGRDRRNDGQRPQVNHPVLGNQLPGQPQRVVPGGVVPQGAVQDDRRRNERDERGRISQPQPQQQALQPQPGQLPQQNVEQQRQRQEYQRQEQQHQDAQRQERQRQDAQHQEQQRQEAQRQDRQRQDGQRQDAQRQEVQRQEQQRQEQQRQEAQRQEQQRQESQRQQEAQRQDAQRQEQQRQRQEIQQRQDAQRQDQQRQEQQRQEAQRQDQQRQEMQRQDQQRREQREAQRQQVQQQQQPPQQQRQEARPQPQPAPAAEPRRPQREENRENKDGRKRNNQE